MLDKLHRRKGGQANVCFYIVATVYNNNLKFLTKHLLEQGAGTGQFKSNFTEQAAWHPVEVPAATECKITVTDILQ